MFWFNCIFCRKYLHEILYCTHWLQLAEVAALTVDHPRQEAVINLCSAEASRTRAPRITGGTIPGVRRSTAWAMGRTMRRICYGTEMWHMMPEGWACVIRDAQFWNNYEFIFIGIRHPSPPNLKKYFFLGFRPPFLQMSEMQHKCRNATRQEKKFLKYPHF